LDIGGQHGRRLVLLHHTHRLQRRLYPIWTSRNRNAQLGAEMIKPDPGSSFEDHSRGVGAGVGDENVESCRIVHPPCIALMIHPVHRSYVVVRKTDELLCGRYKWVSRFEVLYICTWWTGER